jgi:hypothetical protein
MYGGTSGIPIDAYDSMGGTLLATITPDYYGSAPITPGTYYLLPRGGRFSGQTVTIDATVSIVTFGPASGYYCNSLCVQPLKPTLHGTSNYWGAIDLNYDTSLHYWIGPKVVSYPGYSGCSPVANLDLAFTLAGNYPALTWKTNGTWCPDNSGIPYSYFYADSGVLATCPGPPGSPLAFYYQGNILPPSAFSPTGKLMGGFGDTFVLTE